MSFEWSIATPEAQHMDSAKIDALWQRIQHWKSRAGRKATATALVVARHGKLIYERYDGTLGAGLDTPVDEHSIFNIYSGNKTVTQVMVGHLIDSGFINSLGDKLGQYLEQDLGDHPWKDEITLDHLRHHRAGYDGQDTSPYPWTWQWGRDHPLRYRPGSQFIYSSVGTNINAELARRVLPGMPPYQEALHQHILAPLDMSDTRFVFEGDDFSHVVRRIPGNVPEHSSKGAHIEGGVVEFMDPSGSNMGAGWLFASARDYTRFGFMMANGGESILSQQRLREIYPVPINSMLITGLMECQCHVMPDLGLVMTIMINSCADGSQPGGWNHNEYRSLLLKAAIDIPQFLERDRTVCIEAENFTLNYADYKWGAGHIWQVIDDAGASGEKAVAALPEDDIGVAEQIPLYTNRTEIVYLVNFVNPGAYHVWLRGRGAANGRAITLDLDGEKRSTATRLSWPKSDNDEWAWSDVTVEGDRATLTVPRPGIYNLQVLMYDNGVLLDKIYLTQDTDESPSGFGPDESERGFGGS